jgi:hypothetical protein
MSRRAKGWPLAVLLAVAGGSLAAAAVPADLSEYQVKGAFLVNFIRLVEWRPARPIAGVLPVCVLGDSPIAEVLDTLASTPVKGRTLLVRRLTDLQRLASCEVLFIGSSWNELDAVARAVPSGVLTVSEIDTDDKVSSVINFIVEEHRVAFDVNLAVAARAHVEPTARLLGVARAVDGRRRRKD